MTILKDVDFIISYPVYRGPDADEPTGAREPVLVTSIRVEGDADCVGDPPRYRDESTYYIEAAHRIVFGASIPEGELTALTCLNRNDDRHCFNDLVMLPDEEEALVEYVEARLEDLSLRECGFAGLRRFARN